MSGAIDWDSIALTPIDSSDIVRVNGWQNDPEIRDKTMGFRGPIRIETTVEWANGLVAHGSISRSVFAIRHQGVLKGVIQLHGIDWVQRSALLGLYIGDKGDRGGGLGFAAASIILDYGFSGLDLQRVELEVLSANLHARRLYARLGFVHEGTLRKAFYASGRREDVSVYGLLRDEWRMRLPGNARRLVSAG